MAQIGPNKPCIERILIFVTPRTCSLLQVYMTLQLPSTQALKFTSAASVWALEEWNVESKQRNAKFKSLHKKAFILGSATVSWQIMWKKAPVTALHVAASRDIFCLSFGQTQYLFEMRCSWCLRFRLACQKKRKKSFSFFFLTNLLFVFVGNLYL